MTETDHEYVERMDEAKSYTHGKDPCERCGCAWKLHKRFAGRMICLVDGCKCICFCDPKSAKRKEQTSKRQVSSRKGRREKRAAVNAMIKDYIPGPEVDLLYDAISTIINGAVSGCANDHPEMLLKDSGTSISKRAAKSIIVTTINFIKNEKTERRNS